MEEVRTVFVRFLRSADDCCCCTCKGRPGSLADGGASSSEFLSPARPPSCFRLRLLPEAEADWAGACWGGSWPGAGPGTPWRGGWGGYIIMGWWYWGYGG